MCNIVTKRFNESIGLLKENNVVKSARQLALSLDYSPQSMSAIMQGERDVTIDLLRKAFENYPINAQYIFTGSGSPLLENHIHQQEVADMPVQNIYYVPVAAQAGYADQFFDRVFLDELPTFTIPQFKDQKGEFRCFEINGDSMEPTLFSNEKVICSLVKRENQYAGIRNHHVYVVVTSQGVVVKRVINHIQSSGTLELISDNQFYDSFRIPVDEVNEIWSIQVKISPFNGSPSHFQNGFQEKMKEMNQTIEIQSEAIRNLNRTLEQLLKQNRAHTVR